MKYKIFFFLQTKKIVMVEINLIKQEFLQSKKNISNETSRATSEFKFSLFNTQENFNILDMCHKYEAKHIDINKTLNEMIGLKIVKKAV